MTTLAANASNIASLIKSSVGGDVIQLPPGPFPGFVLRDIAKEGTVEIRGDEAGTVIDSAYFSGASGFRLVGVGFKAKPTTTKTKCLQILSCKNVTVESCSFEGDETTPNMTDGIWIRWSQEIQILGNSFTNLKAGVYHQDCFGLTILRNKFRNMWSDSTRGGEKCGRIVIAENHTVDSHQDGGDHLDGHQLWTHKDAAGPVDDVLVYKNVVERGNGSIMQGIQIGDEGGKGFTNLRVIDNLLIGCGHNAIQVSGAFDPWIQGNGSQGIYGALDVNGKEILNAWIILRGCTGGRVIDNAASMLNLYRNVRNPDVVEKFVTLPLIKPGEPMTALNAWLDRDNPVDPPVDPHLEQIATLEAKVSELTAKLAEAEAERDRLLEIRKAEFEVLSLTYETLGTLVKNALK